jgi:exodeoxyribonuclease V alpha subunit
MLPELDALLTLAVDKYKKLNDYAAQNDISVLPDFLSEFVLLSPHNYGQFGTDNLNEKIAERLSRGKKQLYPGMPVMILRNDYENDLFNGDRGVIVLDNAVFCAVFRDNQGLIRSIPVSLLKEWEISYAQTIHKSQGNEYETAAVIIDKSAEKMLTREILYTAVTRAKKEVLIFGEKDTIEAALSRKVVRFSGIGRSMIKNNTGLPDAK